MTRSRPNLPQRQRGIAAITAILIVALATILAVELAWDLNLDIRRTENMLSHSQARQFALGAELIAAEALRQDLENDIEEEGAACDHPEEIWATPMEFPFEGGTVRGYLTDMQGRFNLNELMRADSQKNRDASNEQFERLLEIVGLDPTIATKVRDWIDPDQYAEPGGAEDDVYTARTPPYRAANFWITTPTELLAIDGIVDPEDPNKDLYNALERYVAALPAQQKINVNSAEPEVLLSFTKEVGETTADSLRTNWPYCQLLDTGDEGVAFEVDARTAGVESEFINNHLGVFSKYFQLKVRVTLGTTQLDMYSLLYRDETSGVVTTKLRYFSTK